MPPPGGAGFAGAAVCAAGLVREVSAWWARERRRLRCRLQAVPALPVPPSAPPARCARIQHGGHVSPAAAKRTLALAGVALLAALASLALAAPDRNHGRALPKPVGTWYRALAASYSPAASR